MRSVRDIPPGFDPATMVLVQHDACKGTGILSRYPRDSQACEPCKGSGFLTRHRTDVLAYGCNRCPTTWPNDGNPYCPTCSADATHYQF